MSHLKKFVSTAMAVIMVAGSVPVIVLAAPENGWVKKDGKWYYYEDGKKLKNTTAHDGSKLYLLDSKGARITKKKGWVQISSKVETKYGDKYTVKDWYYVGTKGKVATGWKKIGKKWYLFDYAWGQMAHSTAVYKSGKFRLLDDNGKMVTKKGWYKIKHVDYDEYGDKTTTSVWYYVTSKGVAAKGFKTLKGTKYYFGDDGVMRVNEIISIKNEETGAYKYYVAKKDGTVPTKKGWVTLKITKKAKSYFYAAKTTTGTKTVKVYVTKGGKLQTGFKTISGIKHYFGPQMYANTSWYDEANKTYYYFDSNGKITKTEKFD